MQPRVGIKMCPREVKRRRCAAGHSRGQRDTNDYMILAEIPMPEVCLEDCCRSSAHADQDSKSSRPSIRDHDRAARFEGVRMDVRRVCRSCRQSYALESSVWRPLARWELRIIYGYKVPEQMHYEDMRGCVIQLPGDGIC